MGKSGTIIIVDDNKGHADKRHSRRDAGSNIAGYEFYIGHQYR